MNPLIESLIQAKKPKSIDDYENLLKEAIQEVCLLGLWRAKFFEHAAFYGGTALRILHGLPRFSEDMDFTLEKSNPKFRFDPYRAALITELKAYDFDVEFSVSKQEAEISRAFLEGNSSIHLAKIDPKLKTHRNRLLQVKIEIETQPPCSSEIEVISCLRPIPFSVKTLSLPDLFAGKMHAVLCRAWKYNVKGRDWYDLLWYINRSVPVRIEHLEARMIRSGNWSAEKKLTADDFKKLFRERVKKLDVDLAKKDLIRFISNPKEIEGWSTSVFLSVADQIKTI